MKTIAKIMVTMILFVSGLTVASTVSLATTVETTQDEYLGGTGGVKINGLSIDVDRWTGWILVNSKRSVVFDIDLTRVAATHIFMRCETSRVNTTANDAGRDLHATQITCAAGACTATSGTLTWDNTVASNEGWTWEVTDIPGTYINCLFTSTLGGGNDLLTVYVRGITP